MRNHINFFDAELISNELWFSNLNFNALMKINIENGRTEIVSVFDNVEDTAENLHIKVIRNDDNLFFIPYVGNVVHIWNIQTECFDKSITLECSDECLWVNAYKDSNDIIWMIPEKLNVPIITIDMKKKTVNKSYIADYICKMAGTNECTVGTKCVDYYNNVIYIQLYKKNLCFCIDCNTGIVNKITLPEFFLPTSFRVYNENTFYLFLNEDANLYKWDNLSNNFEELHTDIPYISERTLYWDNIRKENKIIIIPCHGNDLILYDIETKKTNKIILPKSFHRCSPYALFGFHKIDNEKIYLFPRSCNEILIINVNDFTTCSIPFVLIDDALKYAVDMAEQIFETKYNTELNEAYAYSDSLRMFLDKLVLSEDTEMVYSDSNIGFNIHKHIMNEMEKD